uniref:Uncharacterized protein n=1 Tax=Anguilla anguilla TaxID=7936 RepID=A0A0E9TP72_ANGAN
MRLIRLHETSHFGGESCALQQNTGRVRREPPVSVNASWLSFF